MTGDSSKWSPVTDDGPVVQAVLGEADRQLKKDVADVRDVADVARQTFLSLSELSSSASWDGDEAEFLRLS
jgi:hypothetical protein